MIRPGDILDYRGAPVIVLGLMEEDKPFGSDSQFFFCRYLRRDEVRQAQIAQNEEAAAAHFALTRQEACRLPVIRSAEY